MKCPLDRPHRQALISSWAQKDVARLEQLYVCWAQDGNCTAHRFVAVKRGFLLFSALSEEVRWTYLTTPSILSAGSLKRGADRRQELHPDSFPALISNFIGWLSPLCRCAGARPLWRSWTLTSICSRIRNSVYSTRLRARCGPIDRNFVAFWA